MKKTKIPYVYYFMAFAVAITLFGVYYLFTKDERPQTLLNWDNKREWVIGGAITSIIGVLLLAYNGIMMKVKHNATIEEDDNSSFWIPLIIYLIGAVTIFASLTAQTIY